MISSRSLFLGLALALPLAWSAPAEPLDGLRAEQPPGRVQLAEERVICPNRGNRSCRTITIRAPQPGCRRVSTGGLGRGNGFKTVCGQAAT